MRLTVTPGSQARGLPRRKMKIVFFSIVCLAIVLVTVASVLPNGDDESRLKRHLKDAHQNYMSSISGNDPVEVADLKTLQLVQVIFRHGDRTPIDRFPKDPYNSLKYWPEGWGRLTDRGKQMQYELGQYIRQRYDGYISKKYTADEIYVQSSDKDRTIMSAMANLAGMWPSIDDPKLGVGGVQQFVPVHAISPPLDNKIAFTRPCLKYKQELERVNKHPSEIAFNDEHATLYAYLSEHTGLKITSYFNVSDIYDTLFVQSCHNLTLPNWALSVFPEQLLSSGERWIKANTFTDTMRKLKAGPILTDFVRNMKRVIGHPDENGLRVLEQLFGTPAAKLYMYSGHDTTISAILDGLGIYDGRIPPYASSLYFELHQNHLSKQYYVKLFYRRGLDGSAQELKLKNCPNESCSFDDFMKSLDGYMMDDTEWERECAL